MNTSVTTTAIAVALALIVIVFMFFGNSIVALFTGAAGTQSVTQSISKTDIQQTGSRSASVLANTSSPAEASSASHTTAPAPTTATAQKSLSITNNVVGTGALAQRGDQVAILYKGMFQDGTVFDSSQAHKNKPLYFVVGGGRIIPGMDEGVIGMKVGGTRTIVIPPSLGYGSHAVGPIPANSTLIFEVKLVGVTPPTK